MSLRFKFNLVLGLVFGLGLLTAGLLSRSLLEENAEEEALHYAGLMMETARAVRQYTVDEVRPSLEEDKDFEFSPHSVPSFAVAQNFKYLQAKYPEYTYKEATLNPTNPEHRAQDWEVDIVNYFRTNPAATEFDGRRETPLGESLFLSRPMKVDSKGCLECHSTPKRAPKEMVAQYGRSNGFGWKMNEIVGAQVVSVPLSVANARANEALTAFLASLFGVFAVLTVILNILLQRIVIRPVTQLSVIAGQVSLGEADVPDFESKGDDEIAALASSFTRMRRSLDSAMTMLTHS